MANACTNLNSAVRAVRQFKIDGYSLLAASMSVSEFLKFRWDIDGSEWEIHFYPRCWRSGEWVAIKLLFLSGTVTTCNVKAILGCLLVHPRLEYASTEKRVSHVFKRPKDSASVLLVELPILPVPASLWDDYLTVQCTIMVVKELPEAVTPVPVPSSNLRRHFSELLRTGIGADVTFLVSGESFPAHKNILAARSPVLKAEFFGQMREVSAGRIVIEDMEPAAFKAMLHFIYTDTVLDLELDAVATMAQHLLAAADRYGLDRLKVICESKLSGGITVDTAATTLALAEQFNCLHLKAKCVEFIVSTPAILDAVVATEGYEHLEASCPAALTSILISMRGRRN